MNPTRRPTTLTLTAIFALYNESVALPTGLAIQGGQTYYLSIFSDNGGSTDFWSWMSGSGGDGSSYQYSSYTDSTTSVSGDRTFTLAAAVPEPSRLVLGMIGFMGSAVIGISRRRRRARRTPAMD